VTAVNEQNEQIAFILAAIRRREDEGENWRGLKGFYQDQTRGHVELGIPRILFLRAAFARRQGATMEQTAALLGATLLVSRMTGGHPPPGFYQSMIEEMTRHD
jgi:hypothetical protein